MGTNAGYLVDFRPIGYMRAYRCESEFTAWQIQSLIRKFQIQRQQLMDVDSKMNIVLIQSSSIKTAIKSQMIKTLGRLLELLADNRGFLSEIPLSSNN